MITPTKARQPRGAGPFVVSAKTFRTPAVALA